MKNKLYFRWLETPLGISILSWQKEQLVSFILPRKERESTFSRFARQCQSLSASPVEEKKDPFSLEEPVQSYFQGKKVSFSGYPFLLTIYPSFTRKVLTATASIPYGTARTYGEIARIIDTPQAPRAVGQSLGRNLLPLFIPCHRVVAQNSLGGFGEGLRMKVLLLSIEYSNLASDLLHQGTFQKHADSLIDEKGNGPVDHALQEIKGNDGWKEHSPHHTPRYTKINRRHE